MKYIQLLLAILAAIFFCIAVPGILIIASVQVEGFFGLVILEPLGWMMCIVMPIISIISIWIWWSNKKE